MNRLIYKSHQLPILVALSEEEQKKGLMFKSWPPPIMAFPYQKANIHKFWMKNTLCPLDIIFCRNNVVLAIEKGEPFSENHIGPNILTDLVIEMPKDQCNNLGISLGSRLDIKYDLFTLAKKIQLNLKKYSSILT